MMAHSVRSLLLLLSLACLLSACTGEPEWNAEQQSVHKSMLEWSMAVSRKDGAAMWEMLSPDAQEVIRRELEAPSGARWAVKSSKAALDPEARTPEAERERIAKQVKALPPDPEKMSPKDYYIWKVTPDLTAEGSERTASLFEKRNISQISIEGDRATVILKHGDPDRYSWVRHEGVWKNDVKPSILRELEEVRRRENTQE
jgi:hypothetical protein